MRRVLGLWLWISLVRLKGTQTEVCATGGDTYYERNLPHWVPEGKDIFLTWRLSGSLPAKVFQKLRWEKGLSEGERFAEFEKQLDEGTFGPTWLQDDRIGSLITETIRSLEAKGIFKAHAFVVMPNHVHLLVEPRIDLPKITKLVKGSTARAANGILKRSGKFFWQDESFDHWIRNSAELERVRTYIERNPVKAGLVRRAEEWKWSSAYRESSGAKSAEFMDQPW